MSLSTIPQVSVIIPTYNASAFVRNAVDSVLTEQTVPLELIVVDDQSDDNTWSILESYGDAIHAIKQDKSGPYKARNLGARHARGEWLAFLDADDVWKPGKLQKQLAVVTSDRELVYTNCFNFGDCTRVQPLQSDCGPMWEGDVFEHLLVGNFISLSSVMIHKSWFDRLGGFSEQYQGVQDWDLWLRFSQAGGRVKLLWEPLTGYRHHPQQMSKSLSQRAQDRVAVVQRALQSERGQRVPRKVVRRAWASVWSVGAWQAAPSNRWQAIRWYLRAAWHCPANLSYYKGIAKCCLNRV